MPRPQMTEEEKASCLRDSISRSSMHQPGDSNSEEFEPALPLLMIFAIALLAFGLWFGDRHGWEGDDLNFLFGMANLELVGRDQVYRYGWQPLAYETLAQFVRLGVKPVQLFYLGNVLGMLGVALLAVLSARLLGNTKAAVSCAVLLILGIPELWITALYFNTTAIALPFFVGSLLALAVLEKREHPAVTGTIAGAMFGLACLLRLDFLAALPMAVVLIGRWFRQWFVVATFFMASQAAIYVAFILVNPDLPSQMAHILAKYGSESFPSWTFARGAKVFLAAVAPSLITIPILFWHSIRRTPKLLKDRGFGLALLALLPTLLPAARLYTGKYLVLFFVYFIVILSDRSGPRSEHPAMALPAVRRRVAAWAIIAIMFVFGFPKHDAFIGDPLNAILNEHGVVLSHDGPRTLGGYLAFASRVRAPESPADWIELFRLTALAIARCDGPIVVVLPRNDWYWGNFLGVLLVENWQLLKYSFPDEALLSPLIDEFSYRSSQGEAQ